jgi:hypothetical protein
MAFYRDVDGAIWQDGRNGSMSCLFDPDDPDDSSLGIPLAWHEVSDSFGPLIKVKPTGWEEA